MIFKSDIDVTLVQKMGGDNMMVAAAKVSTSGEEALNFTDEEANFGLINYLAQHRHGCYDDKTDVLTSDGWKNWKEVTGNETFATLNLTNNNIEYQKANRIIKKSYKGKMVQIQTLGVDLLVTPDHNMVAAPRINSGKNNFKLIPASDFHLRSHRLRIGGGNWDGKINNPELCRLIGFICGDGNVNTGITFHLKKQRKIKFLHTLWPTITVGKNNKYYITKWTPELKYLAQKTYDKNKFRCIPREILDNYDSESLQALIEGYINADGSNTWNNGKTFSTTSRQLFDDLQECALKCGLVILKNKELAKKKENHNILYRGRIYRERNSTPKIGWTTSSRLKEVNDVDYDGFVYCVTVPNNTLYVRRNGKPLWCGNSPFEHSALTFFVRAPIFVWREWHRHRIGFSYNEESGRYTTLRPVFYIPARDRPMKKVEKWKAARPKFEDIDDISYNCLVENLKNSYIQTYTDYLKNLELGVDPGLARACLPVGIYSSCWVTCNPRSIMSFLSLRTHEPEADFISYPLYEIELAARQIEKIFAEHWPLTYKAWNENGRM